MKNPCEVYRIYWNEICYYQRLVHLELDILPKEPILISLDESKYVHIIYINH